MATDSHDYLVKNKQTFERELDDRINAGLKLSQRKIKNKVEFEKLCLDFSFWHDFNVEFLKRAFRSPTNQYWKDYATPSQKVNISGGGIFDGPKQEIHRIRAGIAKYLL